MKKFALKFGFLIVILIMACTSIFAADGSTSVGSNIVTWITAIGVPGILAFAFGLWKNGPKLIKRVVVFIITIIDSLGDLLVQVTEAKVALKNDLQKLKDAAADESFSQKEIQDLIAAFESSFKEFEDVPIAIKQLKTDFSNALTEFKATK